MTSLRNMVSNLEEQLKQTTAKLSITKDSALEQEATVSKVQLQLEQTERTAEDLQRRLNRKAGELQAAEEKNVQLDTRNGADYEPQAQRAYCLFFLVGVRLGLAKCLVARGLGKDWNRKRFLPVKLHLNRN